MAGRCPGNGSVPANTPRGTLWRRAIRRGARPYAMAREHSLRDSESPPVWARAIRRARGKGRRQRFYVKRMSPVILSFLPAAPRIRCRRARGCVCAGVCAGVCVCVCVSEGVGGGGRRRGMQADGGTQEEGGVEGLKGPQTSPVDGPAIPTCGLLRGCGALDEGMQRARARARARARRFCPFAHRTRHPLRNGCARD